MENLDRSLHGARYSSRLSTSQFIPMPLFFFALIAGVLFPFIIGIPAVALLRLGSGIQRLGYAAAVGTAAILIACRAVQMLWPLNTASTGLIAAFVLGALLLWITAWRAIDVRAVWREHRYLLSCLAIVGVLVSGITNLPILLDQVIQFDGTHNSDSFTFTSSAHYMLTHAFDGIHDFSPQHPANAISVAYFGADAMQPRPAAEGYLAWLSTIAGCDPIYLYNGLQTAGILLAGISVLSFLAIPKVLNKTSASILAIFILTCPTLVYVGVNSNFANALNLPAATCYLALALLPRSRLTFAAAVLFLGCLISGYPEFLIFLGAIRFFATWIRACFLRTFKGGALECGHLLLEFVAACILLPWAAKGTWLVYKTSLYLSHANVSELGGNMYAGVPMAVVAGIGLYLARKPLSELDRDKRMVSIALAILVIFMLAQASMIARGFSYGGFRISAYFVTGMVGILTLIVAAAQNSPLRTNKDHAGMTWAPVYFGIVLILMFGRNFKVTQNLLKISDERRVTQELVTVASNLNTITQGQPIALGDTPASFYYGMWVPYLASTTIAYNFDSKDDNPAGYLSPYLRRFGSESYRNAKFVLSIDTPHRTIASDNNDQEKEKTVHVTAR